MRIHKSERKKYESALSNYLCKNNGANLKKIQGSLMLVEPEHRFNGGRIDILARNVQSSQLIGIELKAANYVTREICAQLMNYENYLSLKGGILYFVAPKIKGGIYSTMKNYCDNGTLKMFEYEFSRGEYCFAEMNGANLDDTRKWKYDPSSDFPQNYEEIRKAILLLTDKKRAKLVDSIMNTCESREMQAEKIMDAALDLVFSKKKRFIMAAYHIMRQI